MMKEAFAYFAVSMETIVTKRTTIITYRLKEEAFGTRCEPLCSIYMYTVCQRTGYHENFELKESHYGKSAKRLYDFKDCL
jgi:hypothetical protein